MVVPGRPGNAMVCPITFSVRKLLTCCYRTDSIYCIPLHAPGSMIRELQERSAAVAPAAKDLLVKHPLVRFRYWIHRKEVHHELQSATQLRALHSTIASYSNAEASSSPSMDIDEDGVDSSSLSETPLLIALFGWSLVVPAPPEPRRVSTMKSASRPSSPALSRASSVSLPQTPPRQKTPALPASSAEGSISAAFSMPKQSLDFNFRIPSTLTKKQENTLLQCELCQRRVGLWTFTKRQDTTDYSNDKASSPAAIDTTPVTVTSAAQSSRSKKSLPQRAFDLLKEHRSYCPYAVRSTIVPTLPSQSAPQIPATPSRSSLYSVNAPSFTSRSSLERSPNSIPGAVEGWRAALTVVLRYNMAEKQRIEYTIMSSAASRDDSSTTDNNEEAMDVDNVKAMVSGVKARGVSLTILQQSFQWLIVDRVKTSSNMSRVYLVNFVWIHERTKGGWRRTEAF